MPLADVIAPMPGPGRPDRATFRALAGESRQALLAALQRVGGPLDAGEAGASVGLHPNTARVHLEVLCSVGLVERRTEDRSRRGRPRVLYEMVPAAPGPLDRRRAREADVGYRELARLLAKQFSELPDVPGEAMRAGRRWAALLSDVALPTRRLSATETIGVATDLLESLGFEPQPVTEPQTQPEPRPAPGPDRGPGTAAGRIVLHHCPFEELVRESRSVVCGIHLGMLKATVERLDSPLDVVGLEPFVTDEPTVCTVHLALSAGPDGQGR
jgi:predicted ArsR family transcriptional regulator